ncbi:MAG: tRNA preQ1(34) S-adenosylmethionine ribosyltransferase-isomerase QueA [Candidatus Woesearchaeota archaeon]
MTSTQKRQVRTGDIDSFNYVLPRELIAQHPIDTRHDSRLLVVKGDSFEHRRFGDIVDYLSKGDVLVVNESKVMPSKFLGAKSTGARVEVILTRQLGSDWEAIIKGRVKIDECLDFGSFSVKVVSKDEGIAVLRFSTPLTLQDIEMHGEIPIPPYVRVPLKQKERYQTVYSKIPGSVAAHTAGLHFSEDLLKKIEGKGVVIARILLHISYATFFPVRGSISDHKMHAEFCCIDKANAALINNRKARLVAVGTTVVKTLETFADKKGTIQPGCMDSGLFIYPGYKFKAKIDGLITNFHLPKSTLLLLVCAYYGKDRIMAAYSEAIKEKYRFYSFGDAMLLENLHPQ